MGLVGASLLLRVLLCAQGGQYFFGDEARYDRGIDLYRAIARLDAQGVREVLRWPEHALFPWVGAAATACQHLLAQATPYGAWEHHPEFIPFTIWIGAAVLSLFSALNVLLVHRVARLSGSAPDEALWAAALMAASNSGFYFSRHLLPYDAALCAGLGALASGLGAASARRAALAGVLAAAAYHLYNGYWFLPIVVTAVLGVAWRPHAARARLWAGFAGGAAAGAVLPLAVGTLAGGASYWRTMAAFSGTVTQGLFAEGWSLPWEYLWHAEGALGAAVLAALVASLAVQWYRGGTLDRGPLLWLGAAALAYALLVLLSVGAGRFVVYGRTVKPLVPFLCLAGGWALCRFAGRSRAMQAALAAVLALSAVVQFAPHFQRVFPREVEVAVLRRYGNVKHTLSVSGSIYQRLDLPVAHPDLVLVNAQLLYPVRAFIGYPPGDTLLRFEHPLEYLPFQYEGHTPRERALLRASDISIRLIRLADPKALPDDLPPSLRFGGADRATGR